MTTTYTSRELAEAVGKAHGNVFSLIQRMCERNELKAKIVPYQNTPCGQVFKEFRLSARTADKLISRWGDDAKAIWKDYVRQSKKVVSSDPIEVVMPVVTEVQSMPVVQASVAEDHVPTMSSVEIAKLTGKQHAHVMRDIRLMLEELAHPVATNFGGYYIASNGKQNPCFNLPRRETDILLTGYSTTMRAVVIDRWRELEAQVAQPVFAVPTSFADALRLAGELEEQRVALTHQVSIQAEKITEDKPKVDYYEQVRDAENTQPIGDFAKVLGFSRPKLFKWLREQKILDKDNKPYQPQIDAGRFRVLDKTRQDEEGKKFTYTQTVLTGKGKTYVQMRLRKAGDPDLSDDE